MASKPFWADINDRRLKQRFLGIWRRLPESAKASLNELRPSIRTVDASLLPHGRLAQAALITHPEGGYFYHIAIHPSLLDLPGHLTRMTIVHELAHLYLRHCDFLITMSYIEMADTEREQAKQILEDQAAALVGLWGFGDDLEKSIFPGPGMIQHRADPPRWYENFKLAKMGASRN